MFMTPVISTSTRLTADSFGLMHLNALNNSSFHNDSGIDTQPYACPPTYEEAVSFTLLRNLQDDKVHNCHRSHTAGESSINQCEPPLYCEAVNKSTSDESDQETASVLNTVVVNGRMMTENVAYTENSGRLSIVSRTSITGFPIHRLAQISVQTKRARKRRIRHFACVIFAIILALGIPALIVLMTSGVIKSANVEKPTENQNNTGKASGLIQGVPGEEHALIRKRSTNMSSDTDQVQTVQNVKRYQDLLYRLNNARMHSGLHNHKKFLRKLLDVFMSSYGQKSAKVTTI